jgi:hypothetical protein
MFTISFVAPISFEADCMEKLGRFSTWRSLLGALPTGRSASGERN